MTSTSDEDEPMDHSLLRDVLQSLQAYSTRIPEDVGVVITTVQAYLPRGVTRTPWQINTVSVPS